MGAIRGPSCRRLLVTDLHPPSPIGSASASCHIFGFERATASAVFQDAPLARMCRVCLKVTVSYHDVGERVLVCK